MLHAELVSRASAASEASGTRPGTQRKNREAQYRSGPVVWPLGPGSRAQARARPGHEAVGGSNDQQASASLHHRRDRPRVRLPRIRPNLARQADQADRAVRGRRADRHHGAVRGAAARRAARPDGDRREPARQRRHHRRPRGRRRRARRLHAPGRLVRHARGGAGALRQSRLRPAAVVRAGGERRDPAASHGDPPRPAGADGGGVRRLRESQSGQAQLRRGAGDAAASAQHAVQDTGPASRWSTSPTRARRRR